MRRSPTAAMRFLSDGVRGLFAIIIQGSDFGQVNNLD